MFKFLVEKKRSLVIPVMHVDYLIYPEIQGCLEVEEYLVRK